MGRACGVICRCCGTRLTVLVATDRIGLTPSVRGAGPRTDTTDGIPAVLELDAADDDEAWPPCPGCGEYALGRDPNSTDLLIPEDRPKAADTGVRRRRTDQLRATS